MYEIHPNLTKVNYKCPACRCQLSDATALFFQGQHVLADITCTCCDIEYFQTFPVGHGAAFPVSFSKNGEKVSYPAIAELWMAKPLIESVKSNDIFTPDIEVKKYSESRNVIILNCLDDCWGHVFMKMLNAQHYLEKHQDLGLILLIPANFKWLVPEGVAEVWVIHASMAAFKKRISHLDAFVKEQFARFDSVFLSEADIRPDLSELKIDKFTKVERFHFKKSNKPTITFIWREDRFWHRYKMEEWLFLASLKFNIFVHVKRFFVWRQMQLINSVVKKVSNTQPDCVFNLLGIGVMAKPSELMTDLREQGFSDDVEKNWCRVYAESNVVIGVHGSHMLLPTALAGGYVDLIPNWKFDRWGEDIVQPYLNGFSVLLGRCLSGPFRPKLVAKHIKSIIDNQGLFSLENRIKP